VTFFETACMEIDYDSIAVLYDTYVTADFDIAFFTDEVRRTPGAVLELTSGTGRLSVPLIELGTDLTCVDVSRGMLDVLQRKLDDRGLEADIRCADICHLELERHFDLAILPFHSFMEILGEERQRACLDSVYNCLNRGGRFICTLQNPPVRGAQVDGVLRLVGRFPAEDGTLVVSGVEQGGRLRVSRLQLFECFGPDGLLRWKRALPMAFELVERSAFERMAEGAGFRVVELYGNYDRVPFDDRHSPAMIFVLEKP